MISLGSVSSIACSISCASHQPLSSVATPPALSDRHVGRRSTTGSCASRCRRGRPWRSRARPARAPTRSEMRSRSAKVSRSSPATTASLLGVQRAEGAEQFGKRGREVGDDRAALLVAADDQPSARAGDLGQHPRRTCRSSSFGIDCFALPLPLRLRPPYEALIIHGGSPCKPPTNRTFIAFPDLGLSPVALHIWPFDLRWYSLAYLAGIFIGYWYLLQAAQAARRADGPPPCRRPGFLRRARDHPRRPHRLRAVLQSRRVSAAPDRDPEAVGRRHVVPRRRDRHVARHLLSRAQGEIVVAADPRLCRLLRALRPVLRPPRQFREPGTVGRADDCAVGDPLRRSDAIWPAPILGPPRHPSQLYEAVLEGLVLFAILCVDVLEDRRALPARQAGRRLPVLLRPVPLRHRVHPRARLQFVGLRPGRPACTWANGCRCR